MPVGVVGVAKVVVADALVAVVAARAVVAGGKTGCSECGIVGIWSSCREDFMR